jgi:hypothetical protein
VALPRKLGKLAPKHNARTLRYSVFVRPDAPPLPPEKTYWEYLVKSYPMMKNDSVGDCTCACIGHLIQLWTAHTGTMLTPTDDDVLAVYSAVTGYNPSTGENDNGAAITDILDYVRQNGLAGHKIDGWAQIDQTNHTHVAQAIYLFGGLDIGFNVPQSAMNQNQAHETWTVLPDDGGIIGGHSVPVVGYGAKGCTCVTWGALQQMTWEFFDKYCDEGYAPLSLDWLACSGEAPNHLNVEALRQMLTILRS